MKLGTAAPTGLMIGLVAIGATAAFSQPVAAPTRDTEKIAALARLALPPGSPESVSRLQKGLEDESPLVRAAAARVGHVINAAPLTPDLRRALERETDLEVAREMVWALADLDRTEESDAALSSALARPGWLDDLIPSVVAGRGALISGLWPHMRDALEARPGLALSGLEAGLHRGAATPIASMALREAKPRLFFSLLAHGQDVDAPLAVAALGSALASIRTSGYMFLANRGVPFATESLSDLKPAVTAEERAARLLYQAFLMAPRTDTLPAVIEALNAEGASRDAFKARYFAMNSSIRGLKPDERETLLETLEIARDRIKDIKNQKFPVLEPRPLADQGGLVKTIDGHPRGFVQAVIEATGCVGRVGSFDGVEAVYGSGGRATSISPLKTAASAPGCGEAARLLGFTSLARDGDRRPVLILPERPEFLACLAELAPTGPGSQSGVRVGATIKEPTKIRDIKPIYPVSASERSVQGVVILEARLRPSGCLSSIRVLRGVDASIDLAAIDAVSGWRYSPTLVDGVAVPVTFTITVNFRRN
jgi:TonB family protein